MLILFFNIQMKTNIGKTFFFFLRILLMYHVNQNRKVKNCTYILFIIFFMCLPWHSKANADPKPKHKSKTSCTVFRGKYTKSDLIEYNFGIIAGQNSATIKSQKGNSQDIIKGLMGGVAMQIVWPKGFVLQPEILYSQKGCLFSGSGFTYNIDYIEVPIKAMYRLHLAEVKPFFFAAPYGAYAIRITEYGDKPNDDVFSNHINILDFGVSAGAGFDVWKIQLSFKYSWGFTQVANETYPIRNNVFTVSAAFFFY